MIGPFRYRFIRKKKTNAPLKQELANLEKRIQQTENRLGEINQEFFDNNGSCCPSCWSSEYRELEMKQHRRKMRKQWLEQKLNKVQSISPK